MRLFVTGATGFIGSHFARLALARGHGVVAPYRTHNALSTDLEGVAWQPVALDAIGPAQMEGCDALVHFAAAGVSPQRATRQEMTHWNVDVAISLIESAAAAGMRRVVLAGSFAEYGRSADRYERIPPDAPLLPASHYAGSKAACFVTAHAAAIEFGLELCYLRIFSAFGDGQFAANFWPSLKKAALTGNDFAMTPGGQIRDYIAVESVAEHFLHAALRRDVVASVPHVVNVGSGQPVTMMAFARHWWSRWNAAGELKIGALPYRANEVMRFVPLITD